METKTTHGSKVISQSHLTDAPLSPAQTSGIQQSLFFLRSCRSLIFVSLPDVDHREFVSILESAEPLVIVELRRIPRVDLGPLNRQSIFDLFRRFEDVYLDLGTEESEGSNGAEFSLKVQKALQSYVQQQRPLLFLTSTTQDPPTCIVKVYF